MKNMREKKRNSAGVWMDGWMLALLYPFSLSIILYTVVQNDGTKRSLNFNTLEGDDDVDDVDGGRTRFIASPACWAEHTHLRGQ